MKKQQLTPSRANRVFYSVQFMAIMAELIKQEHTTEMDVNFRVPEINMFAGRITKDAQAIILHLKSHPRLNVSNTDQDFTDEYVGELYRVFRFFIGMPIEQIKEFMDGIDALEEEAACQPISA